MNCRVVELKDPCDNDPNECKIKQLCEKATVITDGVKRWNDDATAYVELATAYGLSCDVMAKCSLTNQTICSDEAFLCRFATSQTPLKLRQYNAVQKFVEAQV